MKSLIALLFILAVSTCAFSQKIQVGGTLFDPTGAVVAHGQVRTVDQKGGVVNSSPNAEGQFEINLIPGVYSIEVSATGFLTIKQEEFLVVNSTTGKMAVDFVLFGGKFHEPCGYSGADCLPSKIRSYEIKYSPKLKELHEEFSGASKTRATKPKN